MNSIVAIHYLSWLKRNVLHCTKLVKYIDSLLKGDQ